jgi:hypothetical protein
MHQDLLALKQYGVRLRIDRRRLHGRRAPHGGEEKPTHGGSEELPFDKQPPHGEGHLDA